MLRLADDVHSIHMLIIRHRHVPWPCTGEQTTILTVKIASEMHSNAFSASRSLTQSLLECILYLTLTQYPYNPGTWPSSVNQCILGSVYLRSNLSRKQRFWAEPLSETCCNRWLLVWSRQPAWLVLLEQHNIQDLAIYLTNVWTDSALLGCKVNVKQVRSCIAWHRQ